MSTTSSSPRPARAGGLTRRQVILRAAGATVALQLGALAAQPAAADPEDADAQRMATYAALLAAIAAGGGYAFTDDEIEARSAAFALWRDDAEPSAREATDATLDVLRAAGFGQLSAEDAHARLLDPDLGSAALAVASTTFLDEDNAKQIVFSFSS